MHTVELTSNSTAASGETRDADMARRLNWPLHAVFAIVFAAFLLFYARTLGSLAYTWAHAGTYEYAFLIFPVCLVLVWLRRDWLRLVAGAPRWRGLIGVFGLSLLWLAGAVADINLVQHFAVVALPSLLVYSIYGPAVTRLLVFPLAYMFFAVPWGNFMVGPLQDVTAHLSVFALQFTDVPVYMTGRIIQTPASTWHVAEACSGVKFFIATTAFGILYANLFFQSTGRRLVFVACSLVVPIIANGLRVFFTILIGEHFGIQYATGTDHLIFGWQFFGSVMVLLFLAGWPWHEPEPAARCGALQNTTPRHHVAGAIPILGLTVCTVSLLVCGPLWMTLTAEPASAANAPPVTLTLPDELGGLSRKRELRESAGPGTAFQNADAYAHGRYAAGDSPVRVYLASYKGATRSGHELIMGGNRVFDASVWQSSADAGSPVELGSGNATTVFAQRMLTGRKREGQWLLWYGYRIGGRTTTSEIDVKLWRAWDRVRGVSSQAMVVVLAVPVTDGDSSMAREHLRAVAAPFLRWVGDNVEAGS